LDGVTSSAVTFTFGSPYERYGNPSVVDFAGGVYVRYESPYDAMNEVFVQTTPKACASGRRRPAADVERADQAHHRVLFGNQHAVPVVVGPDTAVED
jgi:hypothetical protein